MTDNEYHQKLYNAKTPAEIELINNKFMKSKRKIRKLQNFKKWCFDNMFNIINAIITLLALIVAILSLLLQLKEQTPT
jgi:lipopolysaccharide/colanic/teichoic acid biosynthesis glycosyltransferase